MEKLFENLGDICEIHKRNWHFESTSKQTKLDFDSECIYLCISYRTPTYYLFGFVFEDVSK